MGMSPYIETILSKKHGLFFPRKTLMMRRSLDIQTMFRKKIMDFLYRKWKFRGALIIVTVYGVFVKQIEDG